MKMTAGPASIKYKSKKAKGGPEGTARRDKECHKTRPSNMKSLAKYKEVFQPTSPMIQGRVCLENKPYLRSSGRLVNSLTQDKLWAWFGRILLPSRMTRPILSKITLRISSTNMLLVQTQRLI